MSSRTRTWRESYGGEDGDVRITDQPSGQRILSRNALCTATIGIGYAAANSQ